MIYLILLGLHPSITPVTSLQDCLAVGQFVVSQGDRRRDGITFCFDPKTKVSTPVPGE